MSTTDSWTECEQHEPPSGTKRLLFVDDDITILEGYQYIFDDEGFQVDLASSQDELLQLLEQNRYDIIIMDYHIGYLKGFKVAEQIQQIAKGVKIIFISGQKNAEEELYRNNVGIAGFFLKPLKAEELLEYISGYIMDS
jgi:DNA-binding response OmpR family regulator